MSTRLFCASAFRASGSMYVMVQARKAVERRLRQGWDWRTISRPPLQGATLDEKAVSCMTQGLLRCALGRVQRLLIKARCFIPRAVKTSRKISEKTGKGGRRMGMATARVSICVRQRTLAYERPGGRAVWRRALWSTTSARHQTHPTYRPWPPCCSPVR